MSIRVNLLAEAKELEELRRKDPVKRVIWIGVSLVAGMLVWSSSLWVQSVVDKKQLATLQQQIKTHAEEYEDVLKNEKKLKEAKAKLAALDRLSTNRFLYGNLLDGLQHATVENVQLTHLKVAQIYRFTPATKPKTNDNRVIPGKPATSAESIIVSLRAKDSSSSPGDAVSKFKQAIGNSDYFKSFIVNANDVRLTDLGPPQRSAGEKPFLLFTVECRYPEKTR
jgi:Tfp pilus assembly protein PilN